MNEIVLHSESESVESLCRHVSNLQRDRREQDERITELELMLDELADEMGSKVGHRKEYKKHRRIVEHLLVDAYELTSAQDMYWVEPPTIGGAGVKLELGPAGAGDRIGFGTDRRRPHRTAQVTLYYLLNQHCVHASMRNLESLYGYSRFRFHEIMSRLDVTPGHRAIRLRVERDYLDQLGLFNEPLTDYDPQLTKPINDLKQYCLNRGIAYRRSLLDSHD
ncbi:hypothetical protein [Spirosoma oryzae]|uniref:hypothetical protein n=1 Tax=Spirosoma oryzae TaxID=1469603 RepID=UPI0011B290B3|nr:hypothetical protein [Spirosoma oryzae]